jgi:hypothetical protein
VTNDRVKPAATGMQADESAPSGALSVTTGRRRFQGLRQSMLSGAAAATCFVIVGLATAIASQAEMTTTGPGTKIEIYVRISDNEILMAPYALSAFHGQREKYLMTWQEIQRGQLARFIVINSGHKPHNFSILGKKTPILNPGRRAQFTIALMSRGAFRYMSTVSTSDRRLTGVLTVY